MLRKMFFYFVGLLYVVLCPMIILYALGYILTPHADERLVKTGMIHLESLPSKAQIYLDRKLIGEKTPATLSDLIPGTYDVEVALQNFRPWKQKIVVEAGKASIFEQILLIPKVLQGKILLPGAYLDFLSVPHSKSLIVFAGGLLGDAVVYDLKENTARPLLPERAAYASAAVEKIFTERGSPFVVVQGKREDGPVYLWLDPSRKKAEVKDLTPFLSREPFETLSWDPKDKDRVYVGYRGRLGVIQLHDMTFHDKWAEKVTAAGLWDHDVYVIRANSVQRIPGGKKRSEGESIETEDFIGGLFKPDAFYRVWMLSPNLILFLSESGELLANRLPYHYVPTGVLGFAFLAKSQRIIFWTRDKLGAIDFSRSREKEKFFEVGPEIDWIVQDAQNIRQAFWVNEGSHAVYSDENTVYLAALNGETGAEARQKLVDIGAGSSFAYDDDSGRLLYLDPVAGNLNAVRLIPEEKFLNLSLPAQPEKKPAKAAL